MKRIIRRVQSINERAAELTSVAGQLPKRVAELREAMKATTGQLHSLTTDIQVNVADLQVTREDDIGAALVEVAGHAPVFAQAGYLLEGLDVEVSPVQRIIVQLAHQKDVNPDQVQQLISQHPHQATVRSILSAMLKARVMVDSIEIDGLEYDKLMIGIGPVPTIRLCWRDSHASAGASAAWQPARSQPLTGGAPTSFFGPPIDLYSTAQTASLSDKAITEPQVSVENEPADVPIPNPGPSPKADESKPAEAAPAPLQQPAAAVPPPLPAGPVDPLARFKVMPQLDRPRR